jgi:hypothetical protein
LIGWLSDWLMNRWIGLIDWLIGWLIFTHMALHLNTLQPIQPMYIKKTCIYTYIGDASTMIFPNDTTLQGHGIGEGGHVRPGGEGAFWRAQFEISPETTKHRCFLPPKNGSWKCGNYPGKRPQTVRN